MLVKLEIKQIKAKNVRMGDILVVHDQDQHYSYRVLKGDITRLANNTHNVELTCQLSRDKLVLDEKFKFHFEDDVWVLA